MKRQVIRIRTKKDGRTVLNARVKQDVTLAAACELIKNEVDSGYADYGVVTIDGEIYEEMEA